MESGLIVLGLLIALLVLALFIAGFRNVEIAGKRADYAQAFFTLLAFIATAYWFFVERKGMPHADVTQTIYVQPIADRLVAVEAHVNVKNLGERLLEVGWVYSRLQLSHHRSYDFAGLNAKDDDPYWDAVKTMKNGSTLPYFNAAELQWPTWRQFDRAVRHEIEPGESDLIVLTYVMSCDDAPAVRVATDIFKPSDWFPSRPIKAAPKGSPDQADPGQEEAARPEPGAMAWKTRTFASLDEACSGDEGGQANESRT